MNKQLDYILAALRRSCDNSYPWSGTPAEAGVLVEEMERLRTKHREQQGENDALRAANIVLLAERDLYREAWAKAQAHLDCGSDAADALREERAAVVAWLREEGSINSILSPLKGAADEIERGEHRREEKP